MTTVITLTLLHSLWQGLLLAGSAALVLAFTKGSTAALRYRCLCVLLTLFAAGVITTFSILTGTHSPVTFGAALRDQADGGMGGGLSTPGGLPALIVANADIIAALWVLAMCAKSLRLGYDLLAVHRLRHVGVHNPGNHWTERLQRVRGRLGVTRPVQLLQSELARAPVVLGHLKPVILVPLGLLTRLSVTEVDAILSHELAHIRRSDYLANLLQNILEIALCFNPAVLWVNKLIRDEREHCCDELALRAGGGAKDYIRAMISCHDAGPSAPQLAMAFAGNGGQLLSRVNRILYNRPGRTAGLKTGLTGAIICAGLALAALSAGDEGGRPVITRHTTIDTKTESVALAEVSVSPVPALQTGSGRRPDTDAGVVAVADVEEEDPGTNPANEPDDGFTNEDAVQMQGELCEDGLITNPSNLSFSLSQTTLIVNGVRQPGSTHRKYAARYLKGPGTEICYQRTTD